MIYYAMAATAALLFSGQFLFNRNFERLRGNSLNASLVFSFYSSAVALVLMLALNRFRFEFTWFAALMALLIGVCSLLYSYCSIRALAVVDLAVYSNFAMLGGMLLPAAVGICCFQEKMTVGKGVCCVLIIASLLVAPRAEKEAKDRRKTLLFSLAVFVLNGCCGVISMLHNAGDQSVSAYGFMALQKVWGVVLCVLAFVVLRQKFLPAKGKELLYAGGHAVLSGVGNLLLLIALAVLPGSVQYPLVTGGVLVFSAIINVLLGEKLTARSLSATLLAFAAAVAVIF